MIDDDLRRRLCAARRRLATPGSREPIAEVARTAGMSTNHFVRAFRRLFGQTPHQSRIRDRMDRARARLVFGQEPVTDIGFTLGMASPGSFSARFRLATGSSPSAYRQAHGTDTPGWPRSAAPPCLLPRVTRSGDSGEAALEQAGDLTVGGSQSCESSS